VEREKKGKKGKRIMGRWWRRKEDGTEVNRMLSYLCVCDAAMQ
jgi:hypothetical protein